MLNENWIEQFVAQNKSSVTHIMCQICQILRFFFPPEIAIFGQTIGSGGSPKYSRINISSFLFDLPGYQRGYH
jgi:hypothetical protein